KKECMRTGNSLPDKIMHLETLLRKLAAWRLLGKTVSFTNGCFDLLHAGHIASLVQAASEADLLVVGLNADVSVKGLKGPGRPLNGERARAEVLAALSMVDAVVLFETPTPLDLIRSIRPDVLVKGGDYRLEDIVGAKEVMEAGGRVVINPIVEGFSTTGLVAQIRKAGE
ncbi:MAG TPA: D-glycero-beta-D-manno-heptose 1-phosphate adenylyltransferase, partial [Chitinophagaceae bacterium]|nr:D-glycero-beta-D-manno-heptose 1-phosphate adenylyltransferase [Chitinophagaceae bacterium]